MAKTPSEPFPSDAFEVNRAGRMTGEQHRRMRLAMWRTRINWVLMAILAIALAAALVWQGRTDRYAIVYYLVASMFIVGSFAIFYFALFHRDDFAKDLRSGAIETVEGAIGKHMRKLTQGNDSMNNYFLEVDGRTFEVDKTGYDASPEAGWVRAYVLPTCQRVVNLEILPDRQVEGGLSSDAARAMANARLIAAIEAKDLKAVNEARAGIAAMTNLMAAELTRAIVPPAPEKLDPRPLVEAIVGTWTMGPVSITFRTDGSMASTLPGGRKQVGKWSVDKHGRLLSSATGEKVGADAWVAEDVLTIADGERGLTFKRAKVQR
jgi:hypothetical protein